MTIGSSVARTSRTISATPSDTFYNVRYSLYTSGLTSDVQLPSIAIVLNNFTVTNGNTNTLQANKTVKRNLSVNTGVFDIVDKTINRNSSGGTLSIADSAKLKIGGLVLSQ